MQCAGENRENGHEERCKGDGCEEPHVLSPTAVTAFADAYVCMYVCMTRSQLSEHVLCNWRR